MTVRTNAERMDVLAAVTAYMEARARSINADREEQAAENAARAAGATERELEAARYVVSGGQS